MFRRKDEENEATEATEVKSTETTSTASSANNNNASSSTTAAAPTAAPRPAEQKPAAVAQPAAAASSYRPAPAPAAAAPRPAGFSAAPAASTGEDKSKKRILTVGNDILLKGEIATCDRLVIEGAVDAKLNDVHTVEIAETGSFKGSAQIEDAEISGLFEGDLVVRNRLIIYSTGKVRGKITYGEIEIERGGELTGEIKTGASAAEEKSDKSKSKAA